MTRIIITPANVADIAKLADGATAYLEGDFPTYRGPKKAWAGGITLDCSKATLNGWYWTMTAGVTFLKPTLRELKFPGLRFDDCQRIRVVGARTEATGVKFVRCADIEVEGGVFMRAGTGVGADLCTDVRVLKNAFRLSTSDGCQFAGCQGVRVVGNSFDGTERPADQHPDAVQFWSKPGAVSRDIYVADNDIAGNMQGITSFDPAAGGIEDVLIENNRMVIGPDMKWGIALQNARRAIMRGNTLRTMPGSKTKVGIDDRGLDGKWGTSDITYEGENMIDGMLIPPSAPVNSAPAASDALCEIIAGRTVAKLELLKTKGRLILDFKKPAEAQAALAAVLALP